MTDYTNIIQRARMQEAEQKSEVAQEAKDEAIDTGLQLISMRSNPQRGGNLAGNMGYLGATDNTFTPYILVDKTIPSTTLSEDFGNNVGFYGYRPFSSNDIPADFPLEWSNFNYASTRRVEFDDVNTKGEFFMTKEDEEEFIALCKGGIFL